MYVAISTCIMVFFLIFYFCVNVCVCAYICVGMGRYVHMQADASGALKAHTSRAGVTGCCGLSDVDSGNQTSVFCNSIFP